MGQEPGTEPRMQQDGGVTVNPNDLMFLNHFRRFDCADGWRRQLFA